MTDHYTRERLREAAAMLRHRSQRATPGPWRLGTKNFAPLVADEPHPERVTSSNGVGKTGWEWDAEYGGCLVAESMMTADRLYMASVNPNVGAALADLMDAVADSIHPHEPLHGPVAESWDTVASAILGVALHGSRKSSSS